MPWHYQGKMMRPGRGWTDSEGRKYPPQWYKRSTDAEKEALGWSWTEDPAPFDNRFYWSAENPKAIDDVNALDEDGSPLLRHRPPDYFSQRIGMWCVRARQAQKSLLIF